MTWMNKEKWGLFFRSVIWSVLIAFTSETIGLHPAVYAQTYLQSLPMPGTSVALSAAHSPLLIKGIKTYPDNPFRFDFFIDPGQKGFDQETISAESAKLIKYFLASLTVPEDQLWVNLSPFEKDRIAAPGFGVTEMGRDLLAQDYLLKQLTASLLDPTTAKGEEFWKKIYSRIRELGSTSGAVNTFNKVWIIPESAEVFTRDGKAFITESRLKVMLEEDYVAAMRQTGALSQPAAPFSNQYAPIVREVIVPAIEKEVNEGENFAMLRQIYHAMILATWFKRHLRESVFSRVYVGQNKVDGVDVEDKDIKEKIYQQYLVAFQKGVFNFIREDYDPVTDEVVPRKYFAGGVDFTSFGTLSAWGAGTIYRETNNPNVLRKLTLKPADFMGQPFYKVSSVVINQRGVDWYNSMRLAAPQSEPSAAGASSALTAPLAALSGKIFQRPGSIRRAVGVALSTILLVSSLGFATKAEGAQFRVDDQRGVIVQIERGDTLGDIARTLRAQKIFQSDILSGQLWGTGGAVEKVAVAMNITNPDLIKAGETYIIPSAFLTDPGAIAAPVVAADAQAVPAPVIERAGEQLDAPTRSVVSEAQALTENSSRVLPPIVTPYGDRLPIVEELSDRTERRGEAMMSPSPAPDASLNPLVPATVTSLLLAALAWAGRNSPLMAKTAKVIQFPRIRTRVREQVEPSLDNGREPETESGGSVTRREVSAEDLNIMDVLGHQIRSMSLEYAKAFATLKSQAKRAAQAIAVDYEAKLTESGLFTPDFIRENVRLFVAGFEQALIKVGERILDLEGVDSLIDEKSAELARSWVLSSGQDLPAGHELYTFVDGIGERIRDRQQEFENKLGVALNADFQAVYGAAMDSALAVYEAMPRTATSADQILSNTFDEMSRDVSRAFGIEARLNKPSTVAALNPVLVTRDGILHSLREQSLETKSVDATFEEQAKAAARLIGQDVVAGLSVLKLSTREPQPDVAASVEKYFVSVIARYFLTALYQGYDARSVERLMEEFAVASTEEFQGMPLDHPSVQLRVEEFVNGRLKDAVAREISRAIEGLAARHLFDRKMPVYQAAVEYALQKERAIANGSGVLVVPTIESVAREVAVILREDNKLAPMPLVTKAMYLALHEQARTIAPQTDATPDSSEARTTAPRAPPGNFAALDGMIMATTAAGMLATGQTDMGGLLATLISPFMFRASLTASYWVHEFSHMLAGGPWAWSKENLRANLSGSDWVSMLSPFFGKVASDGKVEIFGLSPFSAWINRISALGVSGAIFAGLSAFLGSLWNMGYESEVFAFIPALYGTLAVFVGSVKTDLVDPLRGKSSDCEFNCGVAMVVIERLPEDKGILSVRMRNIFKELGRVTDIRGQQAAGLKIQAVDRQGSAVWVDHRMVNAKRGDLPQSLDQNAARQAKIAEVKGYKAQADYNILVGHYRYGTSSAPKTTETHPHQWMPDRKVKLWSLDSTGQLRETDRVLGVTIVHNGDFDFWSMYGQMQNNGDIGLWLERVLQTPNSTLGDSPKIAGMMDYIRAQGLWDAAARWAYYETVAGAFADVFGGEAPSKKAPNAALSVEIIDQFAVRFSEVFARKGPELVRSGDKDLSDLWKEDRLSERIALINALSENLRGMDIVQNWDRATRQAFVESALRAFLLHDEFESAKVFIQRAQGSFGLGIGSTLKTDGVIIVADGQPLAIGMDKARKNLLIASEPSALKINLGGDKYLDYRLTLRQNMGRGEVVNISSGGNLTIFSRDLNRDLTETEIESRLTPLQNNPYMTGLPQLDSDDPVGDDIRDTSAVMARIKEEWDNPVSPNRKTARNILRLLTDRRVEHQIKSASEAYAAIEPLLAKKADDIAHAVRRELVATLQKKVDASVDWEKALDLNNGSARFSLLLSGALGAVIDFDMIDGLIAEEARAISAAMLDGKLGADGARGRMTRFAREELNRVMKEQIDLAEERVLFAANSWQNVVAADLMLQARRVVSQTTEMSLGSAGQMPFQKIEDLWRSLGLEPGFAFRRRGEDIVVTGMEISLWTGEQFVNSLRQIFPELRIKAESSNKILEDPISAGIDDETIVLAISQSGQTFPTLNAAIALEQLSPGRVFALTGEWDTLLGQAVGQEFMPDSHFGGHIISNFTGFRPSEAVSLTGTATHVTLTELSLRLAEDFNRLFPSEKPFGLTLTPAGIDQLKALREDSIAEVERITGVDRQGKAIASTENKTLYKQAKVWAQHILDEPFSKVITTVHLIAAVVGGFMLFPALANVLPVVIAAPAVLVAQYFFFEFFKYATVLVRRAIQGRELFARTGKRTIVIGERSYVHQTLEMFLTKLNSLSKSATAIDVHGANPGDHMVARFGHRVVRGSLIWLGVTDGRLGGKLAEWQGSIGMTGKQAKGVRNFGVGAEVVSVGRERPFNQNATDVDIVIGGDASSVAPELAMLYEERFDSLSRLVSGQVFFYRMMRIVSTLDLPPSLRRFWPWAWKMNRTQSGPRIATTASPRSAPDINKFVVNKPQELPLGLHEDHAVSSVRPAELVVQSSARVAEFPGNRQKPSSSSAVAKDASVAGSEDVGGIDLNPNALKLKVKGQPIPLPTLPEPEFLIDPVMLRNLPVDHFAPMIIDIVPILNVEMFLGMAPSNPEVASAVR